MQEAPPPTPVAAGVNIVFVYTMPPGKMIADAMRHIREAGGKVDLIGPQIRNYDMLVPEAETFTKIYRRAAPVRVDPENRPRKYSKAWASIVARNLGRRVSRKPAERVLGQPTLWWASARQDPRVMELLDRADVLTAVDANAVYLVWNAARRNERAAAINGVGPTLEHLGLTR